jgi:hypothetical protein
MNIIDLDPVLLHDAVLAGLELELDEWLALDDTGREAVTAAEAERLAYHEVIAEGDPA